MYASARSLLPCRHDNQLALNAGWDETLLRAELAALQEEDFNVALIGFEDEELARLLAAQDAAEGLTDEDAIPELPETPISLAGDLWILGDHRLLVGDATDDEAVAKLMAGAAADLIFTDPPYNVDYEGYTKEHLKIKGDRMSDADFKPPHRLAPETTARRRPESQSTTYFKESLVPPWTVRLEARFAPPSD